MQNLAVRRSSHALGTRIRTVPGPPPVAVLRYGPQPVVERPAPQGEALAHHTEAAAVVERDCGVEASPAVELNAGPEARRPPEDIKAASR